MASCHRSSASESVGGVDRRDGSCFGGGDLEAPSVSLPEMLTCYVLTLVIAAPGVASSIWLLRRGAIRAPAMLGFGAGVFSGGLAGFLFLFHCPYVQNGSGINAEMAAVATAGVVGALLGRNVLVWQECKRDYLARKVLLSATQELGLVFMALQTGMRVRDPASQAWGSTPSIRSSPSNDSFASVRERATRSCLRSIAQRQPRPLACTAEGRDVHWTWHRTQALAVQIERQACWEESFFQ